MQACLQMHNLARYAGGVYILVASIHADCPNILRYAADTCQLVDVGDI